MKVPADVAICGPEAPDRGDLRGVGNAEDRIVRLIDDVASKSTLTNIEARRTWRHLGEGGMA